MVSLDGSIPMEPLAIAGWSESAGGKGALGIPPRL